MRSSAEIKFRLRQESANLYLALAKPTYRGELPPQPLNPLPDPRPIAAALRGSLFEFTVLATAQNILSHRFPLLGLTLETGPKSNGVAITPITKPPRPNTSAALTI